ncbi:MAG: carboxypeptidase regulatory-like domain-containing protein [Acidobacteriota bacterium]|nr:carboxypeptidase regulatory-like domain-containing protein [Acidobacteriota bacterium]
MNRKPGRLYFTEVHILIMSLTFAALCVLAPEEVRAQDLDTVTMSGRVTDQNGAIIPGATVTAVLFKTSSVRSVASDDEGRYKIIQLEPGGYTIRVSMLGFATEEKTHITTSAGQNVQLDFTLRPAGVTAPQVVVEESDTPPVDTSRTVVGGAVTTEEVEALPNNSRSPLDLIFTLGGVSEEPLSTSDLAEDRNTNPNQTPEEAGTFSLSGGPAYSNNITSIEGVEEVQVIRNQFSAEYGRASGGRINIRTRGGSNRYRGRVFDFYRNDFFNAEA